MHKNTSDDLAERAGHSIVCLEVIKSARKTGRAVSIVATVPRREGTLVRSWGNLGRSLSVDEGRDMAAWILQTVQHALMADEGLQATLPLA